jgi:hypothetical protein
MESHGWLQGGDACLLFRELQLPLVDLKGADSVLQREEQVHTCSSTDILLSNHFILKLHSGRLRGLWLELHQYIS